MKHAWKSISIVLTTALILVAAADTDARTSRSRKGVRMEYNNSNTFSITAQFLGSLEGRIRVGGREVYVPRTTTIYVVGQGMQEDGYFVNDDVVYVSGVNKRGQWVATMIVVRPSIRSAEPQRATTGRGNPLVGEFADDAPE
jgi:hypothetical protein